MALEKKTDKQKQKEIEPNFKKFQEWLENRI